MKQKLLFLVCLCISGFAFAQIPANNDIANAIDVTASITFPGVNTQNATAATAGEPAGCGVGTFNLVYYKHTATVDGDIIANVVSSVANTTFAIWFDAANANATTNADLTLNPNNGCTFGATGTIPTVAGNTYYVLITNPNVTDIQFVVGDFTVPANDQIANAIDISFDLNGGTGNFTDPAVDHRGATGASGGGMISCDIGGLQRVYYKFQPVFDGALTTTVVTPDAGAFGITYNAPDLNLTDDASLILAPSDACNFGATRTINLIGGQSYYMLVSNPLAVSDVFFSYGAIIPIPPNNELPNAIDITTNNYTDTAVSFPGATSSSGNGGQVGCSTLTSSKIYYKFTAQGNGTVTGTLSNPSGVALVLFYTSSIPNPLVDFDLDDFVVGQACATSATQTIDVVDGTTYYILVGNGAVSDFTLIGTGTTLAVDEFTTNDTIKIYPTVTSDVVNIKGASLNDIKVFNVAGKQVFSQTEFSSNDANTINVADFNTGLYFIQVETTNGQREVFKFIKE